MDTPQIEPLLPPLTEDEIKAVISGIDASGWRESIADYKFIASSGNIRIALKNFRSVAQDERSRDNMTLFLGYRLGRLAATKELMVLPK